LEKHSTYFGQSLCPSSIPGCKGDTLPHLVTKLRMSGATPTPLYAIKTSTWTTLPLLNSTQQSVCGCEALSDTES